MPKEMGFYQSSRSMEPRVVITSRAQSDWSSEVCNQLLTTVAIVWTVLVDKTVKFRAEFFDYLPGKSPVLRFVSSSYDDNPGVFQFSLINLHANRTDEEFRYEALKAAAHETMHAVQYARGESPVQSCNYFDGVGNTEDCIGKYKSDPSEAEAIFESELFVSAIRAFDDDKSTGLDCKQQQYLEHWREFKSGKRLWRGEIE